MPNITRNLANKLLSVVRFLSRKSPESDIPKQWLLHSAGPLDRKFARENSIEVTAYGRYKRIVVQGQTFLWPENAPVKPMVQVISELLTPGHPHHYLYGQTKLEPDDVVLDIGACEGAFAAVVTNQVRQVIAVEPSIAMCDLMRELFALRGEQCPEIITCLLGAEPSVAHFEVNEKNPGASRISAVPTPSSYPVRVRKLDEVVEGLHAKPTFIKCDAEGAEYSIFSGGQNFLRSHRPKLAVTTYHNDHDYADMYRLLQSLGYNVEGKGLFFSPGLGGAIRAQMIHAW